MKAKLNEIELRFWDSALERIIKYCGRFIGVSKYELEKMYYELGSSFFDVNYRTDVHRYLGGDRIYYIYVSFDENSELYDERTSFVNSDIVIILNDMYYNDGRDEDRSDKYMLSFNHTGVGLKGSCLRLFIRKGLL